MDSLQNPPPEESEQDVMERIKETMRKMPLRAKVAALTLYELVRMEHRLSGYMSVGNDLYHEFEQEVFAGSNLDADLEVLRGALIGWSAVEV